MTRLDTTKATEVATRRITSALTGIVVIIVFVFLLSAALHISPYSFYLIATAIALLFVGRMLKIRADRGAARAVSSLFWNLVVFAIEAIILIYFLGWVASLEQTHFPGLFYALIPDFVLGAFVAGAVAYAVHQAAPPLQSVRPLGKPLLVSGGTALKLGRAELSTTTTGDAVAVPMRLSKKGASGYVLYSDVRVSLDTPMGEKEVKLKSPVVLSGVPFKARRASEDAVRKSSGRTSRDLAEDARAYVLSSIAAEGGGEWREETTVDLPFVHVSEGPDGGEEVDVGPIHVREGPSGEHVRIGPFSIDDDRERAKSRGDKWWFAAGRGGASVSSRGERNLRARWNGSSLVLKREYMRLAAGGDEFEYDPLEVKTLSPMHTLRVAQGSVTLETSKFALNVHPGRVVVRTADGHTKSTESEPLASDLRAVLSDVAMKQVKDVMAGDPIDLGEMLNKTEKVLGRYG